MSSAAERRSSASSIEHGRFLPGVVLDERYRIVGLLGTGSMGEVYRADDLRIGQPIALKFLPEALQQNPASLERFLSEVRTARQVSHPNVVRVHDLGEFQGQTFLSMEYVDGEDLDSLLSRVGRLSAERAVKMAREIAAGLSAAHQRGILHRDLKTANVMIDGRGHARIADFGLAAATAELAGDRSAVGTPAYMAPEMMVGRGASVKTDLYALGLVLYELFTGQHPFPAESFEELLTAHREREPRPPRELAEGIPEEVEEVILACLAKEPGERPTSALAVIAALPGADPLSAAIAAGETPSPALVAAAGSAGLLPRTSALALALVVVLGVLGMASLNGGTPVSRIARLPLEPAVLEHRASALLAELGFSAAPAESARGFERHGAADGFLRAAFADPDDELEYRGGRPPIVTFWFRGFPRAFRPQSDTGRISAGDPLLLTAGMTRVQLDPEGRLVGFLAVAPLPESVAPSDWPRLFEAAGLELARFEEVEGSVSVALPTERTRIWRGTDPLAPGAEVRVVTASHGGRPVLFEVSALLPEEYRGVATSASPEGGVSGLDLGALLRELLKFGSLFFGVWYARKNLRSGRGDLRGAQRIAVAYVALQLLVWLLEANHTTDLAVESSLFLAKLGDTVFFAAWLWALYVAVEPFARRIWPQCLVAWSRLVAGRWRDPLVGRDLLIGLAGGTALALLHRLQAILAPPLGAPFHLPEGFELHVLLGFSHQLARVIWYLLDGAFGAIVVVFLLIGFRHWFRKPLLAYVAFLLLATFGWSAMATSGLWPLDRATSLVGGAFLLFLVTRAGLLASILAFGWFNVLDQFPLTPAFATWYASPTWFLLVLAALLAAFGFRRVTVRRASSG